MFSVLYIVMEISYWKLMLLLPLFQWKAGVRDKRVFLQHPTQDERSSSRVRTFWSFFLLVFSDSSLVEFSSGVQWKDVWNSAHSVALHRPFAGAWKNSVLSVTKVIIKLKNSILSVTKVIIKLKNTVLSVTKVIIKPKNSVLSVTKVIIKPKNSVLSVTKVIIKERSPFCHQGDH